VLHRLQGHTNGVTGVAVTPDGRRAVSASRDHTLRVWDLATGAVPDTLAGQTDWVDGVAVTPDGRRLVSASHHHSLRVWDLATGAVVAIFTADGYLLGCAVAPDGITIVAGDGLGRVHFLRLENA